MQFFNYSVGQQKRFAFYFFSQDKSQIGRKIAEPPLGRQGKYQVRIGDFIIVSQFFKNQFF